MNIKQSTLAAAVTTALAMGASGQAAAYVYAVSSLSIQDVSIVITPAAGASITSFNYNLTNTATLNGVPTITTATCSGTPGFGGVGTPNNCGVGGSLATPVLNALPASVGTVRTDNNVGAGDTLLPLGPVGNYGSSDSVIVNSELTLNAGGTDTHQIAESNLTGNGSASSNSEIKSTTGFLFTFTTTALGALNLSFLADPDLRAQISGELPGLYNAAANVNTQFTLSRTAAGGGVAFVSWAPTGPTTLDCIAFGGPVCGAESDAENLNRGVSVSANGTDDHSFSPLIAGFGSYGLAISNLSAGTWTLTLNQVVSTLVTRQVPEPGVLALMGMGLLGMGVAARRRKQA